MSQDVPEIACTRDEPHGRHVVYAGTPLAHWCPGLCDGSCYWGAPHGGLCPKAPITGADREKHIRDAAFKRGLRTAKLDAARRFFDEATFLKDAFDVWRNRAKSAEGKLKKALRLLRMTEHDLDESYPLTAPAIGEAVGDDFALATCLEERATMVEVHRENMTGFEKTARFMRDAALRLRSRHGTEPTRDSLIERFKKAGVVSHGDWLAQDLADDVFALFGAAAKPVLTDEMIAAEAVRIYEGFGDWFRRMGDFKRGAKWARDFSAPTLTQLEIDAIAARLAKSRETLAAMCEGRQRFTMSIPARPDNDPDLIFSETFKDLATLLALIRTEAKP